MTATAAPALEVASAALSGAELLTWLLGILSAFATAMIPVLARWIWVKTGLDKTQDAERAKRLVETAVRNGVLAAEERARTMEGDVKGAAKYEMAKGVAGRLIEQYGLVALADDKLDDLIHAHVHAARDGGLSE
jgi:hypothetical protein